MKLYLAKKVLATNGKPVQMRDEENGPLRDATIRDILVNLLGAQAATADAKGGFLLWRISEMAQDATKGELDLNLKLSDALLKLAKNPVAANGQSLMPQSHQAQLLLACGLTEEDL